MAKFGQKQNILTCKSGTFMCYTYGQKVWKFHGERSGDKMPGEEEFAKLVAIPDSKIRKKPPLDLSDLESRRLGRSTSTGSTSGSESECSSQPSPLSESSNEDVTHGFLSPFSPKEEDISSDISLDYESIRLQCPPPSPIETKNKVDIKALSNLINSLLKKHSLVQNGLEMLKKKPALALRLQQRRTRKVLADQGIIPPLKSPAAYYEQIQKLERARTGDFLNKKMQDRPERDFLIQKHILEDTSAHDSLVAHQKELKKAQLVDDLNEKIFLRPGVFELVEKNILPADDTVTEALKGGRVQYKKTTDVFEEDSSDAFSPEQPSTHDHGSSYGSPPPPSTSQFSPSLLQTTQHSLVNNATSWTMVSRPDSIITSSSSSSSKMPRSVSSTHTTAGHPYLMRQASGTKSSKVTPSIMSQRNIRKKKEKPKFKKFKYHQYIPPDQQGKANEKVLPNMDTPYSRLLEQQQLYLQLQIMNQQYPTMMGNQKSSHNGQMHDVKNFITPSPPPAPPVVNTSQEKKKRTFTVQQLEEMKVAELKDELKARKEKVTGTKEVLIDRLKRYAICGPAQSTSNQPISESITGLINATIQSTIRANTEQALAAAVSNNGPAGALLLKARTSQKNQDGQNQVLQAQLSPPPSLSIQVVTSQSQPDSRPVSVVPMETQNQDNTTMMSQPNTFQFAPTSNGVQIFSATQANAPGNLQLQQTTASSNQFFNSAINLNTSTANLPNSSVPGQRVIAPAPAIQFKVDTSQQFDYSERQKDTLLHKQQQEIEDLRRMVELHRTQLHQIQEKERTMKQDITNTNNNTSNTNIMHEQSNQAGLSMVEQTMKRQHVSQALQKHLQNKSNNKDGQQMMNGLAQHMLQVKQEVPGQMPENVFAYSTANMPPNVSLVPLQSGDNSTVHPQHEDSPIILSVKPPLERTPSESKEPPKYDQALQMLNEEKRRLSHHSFDSQEMTGSPAGATNDFSEMDDLLELLETKGEIPVTPTRQKAFPQAALIEGRIPQHATMHYHHYNPAQQQVQMRPAAIVTQRRSMDHLQRTISSEELDNMMQHPQRHSLELPTIVPLSDPSIGFQRNNKDQYMQRRHSGDLLDSNLHRRHSGDLLSYPNHHSGLTPLMGDNPNDFTNLLVSSAGDILMDSSRGPPSNLQGRINAPTCISPDDVALHQEPILTSGNPLSHEERSKSNPYLNINDPYTTQPFSPMDTGTSDGHSHNGMIEERVRDPHLSSSSIHDSAHSLDKCLESVSLPHSTGVYLRRYEQPLTGASPQRPASHLIKSSSQELLTDHMQSLEHSMQVDELGWLDLTLSSPHHAPPPPLNLQQQNRTSMHSSMGSILEQETSSPYNLSGEGLGTSHNDFDLIGSLELNSIANHGIDSWEGL